MVTDINTRRILDENTRLKRQVETQAITIDRLRRQAGTAERTVEAYQREHGSLLQSGAGRASGGKGQGV